MKKSIFLIVAVVCLVSSQSWARGLYFKGDWIYSSPLNDSIHDVGQVIHHQYWNQAASRFEAGNAFGLGVGYQINSSLGVDLTYNYYLSKSINFGRFSGAAISLLHSHVKTKTVTVNATWDLYRVGLGDIFSLSPFVTGGIGYSYNKLASLSENNVTIAGQKISVGNGFVFDTGFGFRVDLLGGLSGTLTYRVTHLGDVGHVKASDGEVLAKPRAPWAGEMVVGLKYFL